MQYLQPVVPSRTPLALESICSVFIYAMQMHQPTIPAGALGELIGHLQYMFEHPGEGENHIAEAFASCYRRMADLLPQLNVEGCDPRIMLDYSGNLLWGFEQKGRKDILEALHRLAWDPNLQPQVVEQSLRPVPCGAISLSPLASRTARVGSPPLP